jgi:hypothetical protein
MFSTITRGQVVDDVALIQLGLTDSFDYWDMEYQPQIPSSTKVWPNFKLQGLSI